MRKSFVSLSVSLIMAGTAAAADSVVDQRFEALDARIKSLEADAQKLRDQAAAALAAAQEARAELEKMKAAQSQSAVAAVSAASAATPVATAGANGNAFNPAISIILNGVYAHHSLDPDNYVRAGFPLAGEAGPGSKGLSLGESEVSFAANIDDKFYGQLTLTMEQEQGDTHVGIEEAFIDTTALPDGFSLRAGRFFSNIGYLNSHHAHTDSFTDRPLAYQAFLGSQFGDDGVQLRWVAPTDIFLELGGELFRGESFPAGGASNGGIGAKSAFAHAGGDVGSESSWLAGVSALRTSSLGAEDGFSGNSNLYIADFTWKWAPHGNTKDGGISVRSEYFLDDRDGVVSTPPLDLGDPAIDRAWNGKRRGAYVEGVYRINRIWDAGYRYDKLWAANSGPYASDFDPLRHSVMLTWHNSEFSLFRLQLSHDEPNPNASDNALYLQYQVSLGAHGAHKF